MIKVSMTRKELVYTISCLEAEIETTFDVIRDGLKEMQEGTQDEDLILLRTRCNLDKLGDALDLRTKFTAALLKIKK
jgi:hypothetical protein